MSLDPSKPLTPRQLVPVPDQVRASLRLDRDPIKFIAAKRTPRRKPLNRVEELSPDEKEKLRELEQRRKRLARIQEASGTTLTIDDVTEDAELEAVLHLPEHHYDRRALARFQRANDALLLNADQRHCRIDGSGARSFFVQDFYIKSGTGVQDSPSSTPRGPGSARLGTLPKLKLKATARTIGSASDPSSGALGEDESKPLPASARRPNDGGTGRVRLSSNPTNQPNSHGSSMPSDEQVLQWMRDHASEPPFLWKRYTEICEHASYCDGVVDDIFARARDAFICREAVDPWFGREGPPTALSQLPGVASFHRKTSGNNLLLGDGALLALVAAGDFIFAVDPKFAELLSQDFVRELMENCNVDVVFLSDDEYAVALGKEAYDAWSEAAAHLAVETQKAAQERKASTVTNEQAPDLDLLADGPMTFVIRRATQSNAAELRRVERKMRELVSRHFTAQIEGIKEESIGTILMSDAGDSMYS
jgi:hypothetical protein